RAGGSEGRALWSPRSARHVRQQGDHKAGSPESGAFWGPPGRPYITMRRPLQIGRCRRLAVIEQRIFFGKAYKSCSAVLGCWIRTLPLRKGTGLYPRATQHPRQPKMCLDRARIIVNSVLLIALPDELLLHGPGLGPYRRVFDGHDVFERGRPGPRPALDEVQVLA